MNSKKIDAALLKECRLKKKLTAELQPNFSTAATELSTSSSSSFTTKQVLSRSVHKAGRSLPISPRKKFEVIESLAKKFKLRINLENKTGRRKKEISEEEDKWIEEFLQRAEVSYTTSGREETVYIGMLNDNTNYKQKTLPSMENSDLLEIINGSNVITNNNFLSFAKAFNRELSFRKIP